MGGFLTEEKDLPHFETSASGAHNPSRRISSNLRTRGDALIGDFTCKYG